MGNARSSTWSYITIPMVLIVVLLWSMVKMDGDLDAVKEPIIDDIALTEWKSRMSNYLPNRLRRASVPGLQMAIFTGADSMAILNCGTEHNFNGKSITSKTVFEAASLTKPLTAWAVLDLVHKGKLDLDSTIQDSVTAYTVRQLLQHSAGFGNDLTARVAPMQDSGEFSYAGQGYVKLAEIIQSVTGRSYTDYMNEVVLKKLRMQNSHIGNAKVRLGEANPHVSITMILFMGLVIYMLIFAVISIFSWVASRILNRRINGSHQVFFNYTSIGLTYTLCLFTLGMENGLRMILVNSVFLVLILMVLKGWKEWNNQQFKYSDSAEGYAWSTLALLALVAMVYVVAFRTPIPLAKREAKYVAASGLYTTAKDYSIFIQTLMHNDDGKSILETMQSSTVPVNAHNDWGLGVGVQKGDTTSIWHWGVNYPGFQSFFVFWPEKKTGAVILMNGGPLSLAPSAIRFNGLELAREIVIKTFGGEHHGYWQGVQ